MKFINVFLIIALILSLPFVGRAQEEEAVPVETVFVYKPDGSLHCEVDSGVPVEEMVEELIGYGVEVHSSWKGHAGREKPSLCGMPTGQINIFEISYDDLELALILGCNLLPENWDEEGKE